MAGEYGGLGGDGGGYRGSWRRRALWNNEPARVTGRLRQKGRAGAGPVRRRR